jgi:TRAP-type C4-dicarboxylate transport system substrate-binding protein
MSANQIAGNDSVEEVLAKTTLARQWLDAPPVGPQTSSTVLRISAHIPQASPAVQDVFVPSFRRLWHMTGGGVSTQEHWGGSLHPERQGIQALCEGLTDMCPVYSAWDPRLFPAAQALSLPFLFDSAEGATHVSEWLYRRHFSQDFEGQGVLMGRMVATSEYNLFSRTPMARLEDLAGQRIACSDGLESRIFAALGAIPVGCSTPEAKRRFAEGDVAGVSISDSAALTVGLFQTARYRTQANLVRVNLEYGLSRQFWQQLPDPLKGPFNAWLRGLAQAGAQLFYGLAGAQARAQFVQAGIQLIELDPAQEQRWRAKVAVVERELRDELVRAGRDANALLTEVYQAAEATRGMTSNELMAQALEHPLTNILPMPEGY